MAKAESRGSASQEDTSPVFPGIWWHQPVNGPGFVQIALGSKETSEILADSKFAFPALAAKALKMADEQGEISGQAWRSIPQIALGLYQMLVLMFALSRADRETGIDELQTKEALRAAFRGRISIVTIDGDPQ